MYLINDTVSIWAPLVAQMVKNLPAMWETQAHSLGQRRSLGWEDPLEKEWQPFQFGSSIPFQEPFTPLNYLSYYFLSTY